MLAYNRKYAFGFNESLVNQHYPKVPWEALVMANSRDYATRDALDLLGHMLM